MINLDSNISLRCDDDAAVTEALNHNVFKNPQFLSNQLAGRSNWNVPETIETFRYERDCAILPRGFMRDLVAILKSHKVEFEIQDNRILKPCEYPDSLNGITLRPYQKEAIEKVLQSTQGILCSPTGSGKSLMALEIIRRQGQKALILVHRQELGRQWQEVIKENLGLEAGFIGDGEWSVGDEITIALIQTLSSRENDCKTIVDQFGLICVDECHHIPAMTFYEIINLFPGKFRLGLSATLDRRDGLMEIIFRAIGPVLATVSKAEVESIGSTVPVEVLCIETAYEPSNLSSWNDYITALSADSSRNELIIQTAKSQTKPTLILCDRIAHCEQLSAMMERRGVDHVIAHGQVKNRDEAMEAMKEAQITLGTTSLLGEGLDVSVWGVLILASPISSEIKLMQAVGRCVRPAPGKEKAVIYDLKDSCGFSGASFKKRFEIYKKHRIWVNFDQNKRVCNG